MRCPDLVLSAMSYHPRRRRSRTARAYWAFTASWQDARGGLHRRAGQWYLLELASRFSFRSIRKILRASLNLARRGQREHGGFLDAAPGLTACQTVLAYARHGLLDALLSKLPHDPLPLVESFRTPFGVKTRREALGRPRPDDAALADRLAETILADQREDGSWDGLIVATAQSVHDLLDCGVPAEPALRKACDWLAAQQRPLDLELYPEAPGETLDDLFCAGRPRDETEWERRRHPEFEWKDGPVTCFGLLPIYSSGAALAALCRCGLWDHVVVRRGFRALMKIRGPGGKYYTNYWCACGVGRWLRTGAPKFG